MCLTITKQRKYNCKFKYVYKILLQHCENKELYSFFVYYNGQEDKYLYKLNEEFVSDRKGTKLTKAECYHKQISVGTHVFLNKDEALYVLNHLSSINHQHYYKNFLTFFNFVVVKCKAYTQDKVANGTFMNNNKDYKSAVYTKITPIKIIETVKPKGQYSFVMCKGLEEMLIKNN